MNEKQSEKEKIFLADVLGIFVMLVVSMLFAIAVTFAIGLPTFYFYLLLSGMPKTPTAEYNSVLSLCIAVPFFTTFVWFNIRMNEKGLDRKTSRKIDSVFKRGEKS